MKVNHGGIWSDFGILNGQDPDLLCHLARPQVVSSLLPLFLSFTSFPFACFPFIHCPSVSTTTGQKILVLLLENFLAKSFGKFYIKKKYSLYFSVIFFGFIFNRRNHVAWHSWSFLEYCRRALHWFITCVPVKRFLRRYDALCVLARACRPLGRR